MFKRQILKSDKKKHSFISLLFLLASSSALIFTYRLGSMRIDKGQTPGLRDIGTYFSGGLAILQGENPYENTFFRIGPTGGFLFGVLAKLAPDFLAATLVMAVSIIGFVFFVSTFAGYRELIGFPWLFMGVLVFISSQRENLVNIQITGVLALLAALGYRLAEQTSFVAKALSIIFLAISVETKPHLLGLFILVVLIQHRRLKSIIGVGATILASHVLLSIYIGKLITLEWVKIIFSLGSRAQVDDLPERIAFDTFFTLLGISSEVSVAIMLFIFVSLSLTVLIMSRTKQTYHLGLLIPSLGIFFHYYDLALAFGLFLTVLYKERLYKTLFLSIGLFIIPQNFASMQNVILILLLLVMLSLLISRGIWRLFFMYFAIGSLSWLLYIFVVESIAPKVEIHELSMSLSIIYSLITGVILMFRSPSREKEFK